MVYSWRNEDPSFDQKTVEAHEDALDALEEEARRRGADGVLEPVFPGTDRPALGHRTAGPPAGSKSSYYGKRFLVVKEAGADQGDARPQIIWSMS